MQGQWLSFLLFLFSTYKSWHPEGTRRLSRRAEINKTSAPSSYKSNLMRNKGGMCGRNSRTSQLRLYRDLSAADWSMILVGDGKKSINVNLAVSLYRSNSSYDNKLTNRTGILNIFLFIYFFPAHAHLVTENSTGCQSGCQPLSTLFWKIAGHYATWTANQLHYIHNLWKLTSTINLYLLQTMHLWPGQTAHLHDI